VTLSPEELEALAVKPTENLQAYDLYLRGKSYARRHTRQDLEFALQMFENAVTLDPSFALAYASSANACAMFYCTWGRDQVWVDRAREASGKAVALRWDLPEVQVSQAWVLYAAELHDEAVRMAKKAIERKRDCESAYYLLCRALFAAGRYQELVDIAETAIDASGEDYNVYVPILNCLGAMGKEEALRNMRQRRMTALGNHLKHVPEDARARILLGSDYAYLGRLPCAPTKPQFFTTRLVCIANWAESRMPSMLCVNPGKPGTRTRCGLAAIRISFFFMMNRSSTACSRRGLPQILVRRWARFREQAQEPALAYSLISIPSAAARTLG